MFSWKTTPTLAVVGRYGRLANRLWTYANVLAYARDRGFQVVNPSFRPFVDDFELGTVHDGMDGAGHREAAARTGRWAEVRADLSYKLNLRTRLYPVLELGEGGRLKLEDSEDVFAFLARERCAFLSGLYFEAADAMERHGGALRSFFSPAAPVRDTVDSAMRKLRDASDLIIGVHMRQGDYRTFCDGVMYYSAEEYFRVMKYVAEQAEGKPPIFLVCSDELQSMEDFPGLDVKISRGSAIEDLYKLAGCDYLIGPNSTYSQWASWWGNTPLHVLDWRAAIRADSTEPVFFPILSEHFSVYDPHLFARYSDREFTIEDFIRQTGHAPRRHKG